MITEDELQAYVDGRLDPKRHSVIEQYLSRYPNERDRLLDYMAINIDLRRLYDSSATKQLNETEHHLAERLAGSVRRQRLLRDTVRYAAVIVVCAFTGIGGWAVYDRSDRNGSSMTAFTQEARAAHLMFTDEGIAKARSLAPQDGSMIVDLLGRQAGEPLGQAPDLKQLGLSLVGGRLVPTALGPGVQLLYRRGDGGRVTLLMGLSRDNRQAAFSFVNGSDVSLIYWQKGRFAYSLIGKLQDAELIKIAKAITHAFSGDTVTPGGEARPTEGSSSLGDNARIDLLDQERSERVGVRQPPEGTSRSIDGLGSAGTGTAVALPPTADPTGERLPTLIEEQPTTAPSPKLPAEDVQPSLSPTTTKPAPSAI